MVGGLFLGATLLGWAVLGPVVLVLAISGALVVSLAVQLESYRRLQIAGRDYRQVESLFSLFSSIQFKHPLPPMRGWAISPDFANLIIKVLAERRPRTVLELGSGISTLIVGHWLKGAGSGRLIALEHDRAFASKTQADLVSHGVQEFASVCNAAITRQQLGDGNWLWYETAALDQLTSIDVVIVDGPPGDLHSLARYPALPILSRKLSPGAVIVVDDFNRADEREMVSRWLRDEPRLSLEEVPCEKGAALLRLPDAGQLTNPRQAGRSC